MNVTTGTCATGTGTTWRRSNWAGAGCIFRTGRSSGQDDGDHLSESQRAMVAEKIATVKNGGDRKSDQSANWQTDLTVSQAAELMTVSDRAVHHARTVRRQGIPLNFVVSLNLHRRHLSESQRAMVASKVANRLVGQFNSANLQNCKTTDEAAELFNVSERSIYSAKTVRRQGIPELIEKVEAGDVKVSVAADVAGRHQSTITGYCFFILDRRFIQSSRDSV
ncbi:hypothetical protein [Endozoicomonas sp. ALD040]|uniref:hypothetical protein n=1 Tax=Endozoicomonas sp. ALD040 TaxID=3403079 RepID=UPI003BAE2A96